MDKNLKLELSALKVEVKNGLKTLESLVENIDKKISENEEIEALAKCPNLATLIELSKKVKWDSSATETDINKFTAAVDKVEKLLLVSETEKHAQFYQEIINLSKKVGEALDKKPDPTSSVEVDIQTLEDGRRVFYVDTKALHPLTAQEQVNKLRENLISAANTKILENKEENLDEVLGNYKKLNDIIAEKERVRDMTQPRTLEFAKNIDSKSVEDIVKDAKLWDEYSQANFIESWNASKLKRIAMTKEVINTLISEARNYKYGGTIEVSSVTDASKAYTQFTELTNRQRAIELILSTDSLNDLDIVDRVTDDNSFKKYYQWCNNVKFKLTYRDDTNKMVSALFVRLENIFENLMNTLEYDMFNHLCTVYDPEKDIHVKAPADKAKNIKKYAYDNYVKDLKNAYEFSSKQAVAA